MCDDGNPSLHTPSQIHGQRNPVLHLILSEQTLASTNPATIPRPPRRKVRRVRVLGWIIQTLYLVGVELEEEGDDFGFGRVGRKAVATGGTRIQMFSDGSGTFPRRLRELRRSGVRRRQIEAVRRRAYYRAVVCPSQICQ